MANKVFAGGAAPIRKVYPFTIAGTWVAGDKIFVTCNGKILQITIGTSIVATDIAIEVVASVNSLDTTDPLPAAGYVRNVGGRKIPEFMDFTATNVGAIVYLSSTLPGMDFTVTMTKTSTSGTVTGGAVIEATGPNHIDNAVNWLGGVLPVNNDVVSAQGSYDMLYGLGYFLTNSIHFDFDIDFSVYSGQIGLKPINTYLSTGYPEYRAHTRFEFYALAAINHYVSLRDSKQLGTGTKPVYLQLGAEHSYLKVDGGRLQGGPLGATIFLKSGKVALGSQVLRGYVELDTVEFLVSLVIGTKDRTDCTCFVVGTCDLDTCEVLTVEGGNVEFMGTTNYTGGGTPKNLVINGGSVKLSKQTYSANPFRDIEVSGSGVLKPAISVPANTVGILCFGGTVDTSDSKTGTAFGTPIEIHRGSTVIDPQGRFAAYDYVGCAPEDTVSKLPSNKRVTLTDIP